MRRVSLSEAISLLEQGEILIYPTETVYGLGVDATNPRAIEKLFRLKGRDAGKPVSILVASFGQLRDCVGEPSPKALTLAQKYFPGRLTLVLPASEKLSPLLHAGSGWIGIRQSSHPLAQALVAGLGRPITTTSANPSGQPAALSERDVSRYFDSGEEVYFLPGGELGSSRGSTVVKVDGDELLLLREGDLPFSSFGET